MNVSNHELKNTFPWDYKASRFGELNWMTSLINFSAKHGRSYDLGEPSESLIEEFIGSQRDGSNTK